MTEYKLVEHLSPDCTAGKEGICRDRNCPSIAKKASDGSHMWYITMGHPGFNSRANNRFGYRSQALASAASRRYNSSPR